MKRIQRKRTKGWHMPANAVYVGRSTKWGNSHKITDFKPSDHPKKEEICRELAIAAYEIDLRKKLAEDPHFLDPLKGKDLACWCPLEDKNGKCVPCHADVLLKILEEAKTK